MDRFPDDITKHIANLGKRIAILEKPRASTKTISHTHPAYQIYTTSYFPHGLGYAPAIMAWNVAYPESYRFITKMPYFYFEGDVLISSAVARADAINIEIETYFIDGEYYDTPTNFEIKYMILGEVSIL